MKNRIIKKRVMFINIKDHGASNRKVQEYFQYSESTISFYFQKVLAAILIPHIKYIYQLQLLDLTSNIILQNLKYSSYFDNYISVLDKTHITIHIPAK